MASKEFEFYTKTDLSKYKGKYVVILGDKIMAAGDSAKIWQEIKNKYPDKQPLLAKVPKGETLILLSKWK